MSFASLGQLMMNQFGGYLRHQGDLVLEVFEYENFEFSRSAHIVAIYFVGLELLILLALLLPKSTATRISADEIGHLIGGGFLHGGETQGDIESPLQTALSVDKSTPTTPPTAAIDDFVLEKDDVFTAAKTLPPSRTVNFLFESITYTLKSGVNGTPGKTLLKGIDGVVKAGELCAIMGMSGSGTRAATQSFYLE